MPALWEVEHPYYCSPNNYFSNDMTTAFDSWEAFVAEEGDSDPDLNLVFRWDWELVDRECPVCHGDGWKDMSAGVECQGPCGGLGYLEGDKEHRLSVFWLGQRKGLYRSATVKVSPDDEPAVRTWLTERARTITAIWAPLLDA